MVFERDKRFRFRAPVSLPGLALAQNSPTQNQVPPAGKNTTLPAEGQASGTVPGAASKPSSWHFQTTYGVSSADLEAPYWNTAVDPVAAAQRSTTGVLTQIRYSHSVETPLGGSQALRWGLALVNDQTATKSGWAAALAKDSKAPEWRAWGIGTDLFLVRHMSPSVDFDAGLQADYLLSGVATLGASEAAFRADLGLETSFHRWNWRTLPRAGGSHFPLEWICDASLV